VSLTIKSIECTSVEGVENKVGTLKIEEEENGDNYIIRSFTNTLFNSKLMWVNPGG
jgi:hypothetical protein